MNQEKSKDVFLDAVAHRFGRGGAPVAPGFGRGGAPVAPVVGEITKAHFFGASARCPRTDDERGADDAAGVVLGMVFALPAFVFGAVLGYQAQAWGLL